MRLFRLGFVFAIAMCAHAAHASPRLIVQFAEDDVEAAFAPKSRVERLGREVGVESRHVRRMAFGAHVVELADGADADAVAEAARASGYAAIAFADRRVMPARVANDPFAGWYLGIAKPGINAYAAWDVTTGSPSTIVAVVDTGILPHPDLAGRILPGYDMVHDPVVANDGNGRDPDPTDPGDWITAADAALPIFQGCGVSNSSWHGTNVAGVIAANVDNAQFTAGVSWGARILPVRALGKCSGYFSDVLDGIAWAAGLPVPGAPLNANVAKVINLSLGSFQRVTCPAGFETLLKQALGPAKARAIVAAAGNEGAGADFVTPASCPSVIAVAATTNTGGRTTYTNTGSMVSVSAPGGNDGPQPGGLIPLADNGGTKEPTPSWIVSGGQGTSFAAPIVSGVISLMLSIAPDLTPSQIRTILQETAQPFSALQCGPGLCGTGIVNAHAAVLAALATLPPPPKVTVVEYYHAGFAHHFMTADPDEIAGLDAGAFGGAFVRTGRAFDAWQAQTFATVPVCRFFTTPGTFGARSSHFYTANAVECEGLKLSPAWIYEKIAFHIAVPAAGTCAAGTIPVYRAYNNGQTGAPNHQFTPDAARYQQLTTSLGYLPEGIAFCAPAPPA